jgi:hypothetical protein
LRDLRRRLDAPAEDQDVFELDLYSYDESLIVAADLLDVEVPKGARDEMSAESVGAAGCRFGGELTVPGARPAAVSTARSRWW